ncbi:MAG: hypothetical protein ACREQJ_04395, partial [Candidatus Binatia bacterium]
MKLFGIGAIAFVLLGTAPADADNELSRSALTARKLLELPDVQKAKDVVRSFFFLPHAITDTAEVTSTLENAID